MRVAGIDQGTTSTRALVASPEGKLEVVLSITHKQRYPNNGWVEQDPEEILRNVRSCIETAGKLDALGLDNQGESCLAWDAETKKPLYPIIGWQDRRTLDELAKIRTDGHEATILARAGLPLDPYFSASKLAWCLNNVAEVQAAFDRGTLRLGTTDSFIIDRLTGRFVTDVTTASRTSLMNLADLQWDQVLCDIFGVPMECLPKIVGSTGDFGTVGTAYGKVPLTASIVDQQAALFGFGCRNPGDTKITFGTGAFALMVTGGEIINKPEIGLLPTVGWQLDGREAVYALDGGVFAASSSVNWARDLGLFSDLSEINEFGTASAISSGLVFVPALVGLGCPYWLPNARGVWIGLSLEHRREHLVQSILEGVAFRATEVVEALQQCVPIGEAIPIDGGMSQNPYFVQFFADAVGKEIRPATNPELTGLGTIRLAYDVTGVEPDIQPDFSSYVPRRDGRHELKVFKQAAAISRSWGQNE